MAPDSKHFMMVHNVSWIFFGIVITLERFPLCKQEIPKAEKDRNTLWGKKRLTA
jgi:hypothetical protein